MRIIKRLSLVLVTISLLGGCAHNRNHRLDSALASWHGLSSDQLIMAWGAPSSSFEMQNGSKVLSFQHNRSRTRSLFYHHPETYSDTFTCKINFFTDEAQNLITNHNFIGDAYTCMEITVGAHRD